MLRDNSDIHSFQTTDVVIAHCYKSSENKSHIHYTAKIIFQINVLVTSRNLKIESKCFFPHINLITQKEFVISFKGDCHMANTGREPSVDPGPD